MPGQHQPWMQGAQGREGMPDASWGTGSAKTGCQRQATWEGPVWPLVWVFAVLWVQSTTIRYSEVSKINTAQNSWNLGPKDFGEISGAFDQVFLALFLLKHRRIALCGPLGPGMCGSWALCTSGQSFTASARTSHATCRLGDHSPSLAPGWVTSRIFWLTYSRHVSWLQKLASVVFRHWELRNCCYWLIHSHQPTHLRVRGSLCKALC